MLPCRRSWAAGERGGGAARRAVSQLQVGAHGSWQCHGSHPEECVGREPRIAGLAEGRGHARKVLKHFGETRAALDLARRGGEQRDLARDPRGRFPKLHHGLRGSHHPNRLHAALLPDDAELLVPAHVPVRVHASLRAVARQPAAVAHRHGRCTGLLIGTAVGANRRVIPISGHARRQDNRVDEAYQAGGHSSGLA